jgi:hypothetical protein
VAGRLFRREATLAEMLRWQHPSGTPPRYVAVGHGIFTFATPGGRSLIGHSGAWGGRMFATPDGALTLSGTVNMRGARSEWMEEIADALLDGP